jgi:hypothetical protein
MRNMDYTLLRDGNFVCNEAPSTAAILRPEITDILYKVISLFSVFEKL